MKVDIKEVEAMLDISNMEIQKLIPISPRIYHWIDQYHKILKFNYRKLNQT